MVEKEVDNRREPDRRCPDVTAAEIYQIQPYYRRFNQKYNFTRQPFWNPAAAELNRIRNENLEKFVRQNRPGYRLEDWAYYLGARANTTNSGFSINWPNRKGNSWLPLSRAPSGPDIMPEGKNIGKLEVAPDVASKLVSRMGRQFGASQIGFCLLDRRWVYSHWFDEETGQDYPIKFSDEPGYESCIEPAQLEDRTQVIPGGMKYAIVLVHEMDEKGMATAPALTQLATANTAYSYISFTTVMLAEFVRSLGYNAIPSANDTALNIPLAVDAGFGEVGRNGILINPRYGPRCRISKVITDLPLAVGHARPWGVTEFCDVCGKCARHCPPGAISKGERSFEPLGEFSQRGVLKWQSNHMKCFEYLSKVGTFCGICIRTCPFNKPPFWTHDMARWFVRRRNRGIDSLMTRMDDVLGYGKFRTPDIFWNS